MSIACTMFNLMTVIDALLTTRILVQFIGQIGAVIWLRKNSPQLHRPFRLWLYPLPVLLALVGWLYLFATTDGQTKLYGFLVIVLGVIVYFFFARHTRRWPFASAKQ